MKVVVGGVLGVVDVVVEVVVGEMVVVAVLVYKIKATTSTISTTTLTNATNTTMHTKRNIVIIITATLTRDISSKTIQQSPSIPYHHYNHHYNPITTMTQHTLSYSTLISIK